MARILITGASGFVGAVIQQRLAQDGHEVVGTTTGLSEPGTPYCNIGDRGSVESLLHEVAPEILIHCAAISSVTAGQPIDYYRVNTVGTENLLNAFAEIPDTQRFVLVSTAGVYGNQDAEVLHEELCPKPVHHYGMSKFCCERVVKNFAGAIDYTIVRPFNIIGEKQNSDFIVPKLVNAFAARQEAVRLGNLDVYRDYIDIIDATGIISDLAFSPAARCETVNLCSGRPVSLKDLIGSLEQITGHHIEIEVAAEFVRRNEVWRLLGDTRKLERLLGHALKLAPIEQTLRRMLAAKESGDRK